MLFGVLHTLIVIIGTVFSLTEFVCPLCVLCFRPHYLSSVCRPRDFAPSDWLLWFSDIGSLTVVRLVSKVPFVLLVPHILLFGWPWVVC